MNLRILHVVPASNIGGVEVAIYRSLPDLRKQFDYQVFSIKRLGNLGIDVLDSGSLFRRLFDWSQRPNVIVSSLWMGHLAGALLALVTGARWIPFFHSAAPQGWMRDIILNGAAKIARHSFHDSDVTQAFYGKTGKNSTVIPYRFANHDKNAIPPTERPIDVIFVARLSQEKRLDLLLQYLGKMKSLGGKPRALIALAVTDERGADFACKVAELGIEAEVRINVPPTDIPALCARSALYLSVSDHEGFSMAAVEAMSAGCVPVVRLVGEISRYVDDRCGVIISGSSEQAIEAAAAASLQLLADPARLSELSERARQSVSRYDYYPNAFTKGVHRAIAQQ